MHDVCTPSFHHIRYARVACERIPSRAPAKLSCMIRSAWCSSQQSSELALSLSPGAWDVMSRFGMIASWGHGEGDRVWPRTCSHFRPALLRHCFGAYPAPGATAVFCFPWPSGSRSPTTNLPQKTRPSPVGRFLVGPSKKADVGLGSRALSHGFARVCPE